MRGHGGSKKAVAVDRQVGGNMAMRRQGGRDVGVGGTK